MYKSNHIYHKIIFVLSIMLVLGISYQAYIKYTIFKEDKSFNRISKVGDYIYQLKDIEFGFYYEQDLIYFDKLLEIDDRCGKEKIEPKITLFFFSIPYKEEEKEFLKKYQELRSYYTRNLVDIFESTMLLGLSYKKGLRGKLREEAYNFERIITKYKKNELTKPMLMMRRYEKDFMLKGLNKYLDKYKNEEKRLKKLLEKYNLKENKILYNSLKLYSKSFYEFAKITKRIGFSNNDGLRKDTNKIRKEFKVLEKAFLQKNRDFIEKKEFNLNIILLINGILFLFLLIILFLLRREILEAQEMNPLSKLGGNKQINEELKKVLSKKKKERNIIYFDFDYFKVFNDKFGFKTGDDALEIFSEIIKSEFEDKNYFLGHIGGDDFIVIGKNISFENSLENVKKVQKIFKDKVAKFYTKEEIKRDYIVEKDRFGVIREIPLLRVSASIVSIPPSIKLNTIEIVSSCIADIKSLAKRETISSISVMPLNKG